MARRLQLAFYQPVRLGHLNPRMGALAPVRGFSYLYPLTWWFLFRIHVKSSTRLCIFPKEAYAAAMRVLGRTRLSRSTEESTSIERQREIVENWANTHGHEIIGWAEDVDVSGSVDPFSTPGLGPWLKDDKLHEWDILCAWKMDRLARRTVPLHKLIGWTQEHDKVLVCVADNIDLSDWVGRLIASVIAGVAEGELEAIRERSRSSQRKLREVGRWTGGPPFYGYRPEPLETGGWTMEIDDEAHKVLKRMVEEALEGKAYATIATELNDAGVASPADWFRKMQGKKTRGTKWSATTVSGILQSKSLLGWTTHQGTTVRDATGAPVMKGPPLIDTGVYTKLQEVLAKRKQNRAPVSNKSPLRGVAICWDCETPMRFSKASAVTPEGERYTYFYCPNKCYSMCNGKFLVEATHDVFITTLGQYEEQEQVVIRPVDNTTQISDITSTIADLSDLLSSLKSATALERVSAQIQALDAELVELEQAHNPEAEVVWKSTGRTYESIWAELDTDGRRDLLLKSGVRVKARPDSEGNRHQRGTVEINLLVPHDLQARLVNER